VATEQDPSQMSFEEWDRWRRETGRINRRPLSREAAMKWQRETYGNRAPTQKEVEVRQALAALLNLRDQLEENK